MEFLDLSAKLLLDGHCVVEIELPLVLTPDVPVQPDGEPRMLPAHGDRLRDRSSGHHETGAGDDPTGMTLNDAAIYPDGCPEVIRVDDQMPSHVRAPDGTLLNAS